MSNYIPPYQNAGRILYAELMAFIESSLYLKISPQIEYFICVIKSTLSHEISWNARREFHVTGKCRVLQETIMGRKKEANFALMSSIKVKKGLILYDQW